MRGFEQVPHDLVADSGLSIGARALYPLLRHLAWTAGRRNADDAVPLPTVAEIAEAFGCAASTTRQYVAELREAGWVETVRGPRNQPQLWVIRDASCALDSGVQTASLCAGIQPSSAPDSGAHTYVLTDVVDTPLPDGPGESIPDETFTARFGVELALTAALGVSTAGMTSRERDQWKICIGELVAAGATADDVTGRCAAYRSIWPAAKLTPFALVRHWSMLGAEVVVKTSGFEAWLEHVAERFERETAHEIVSDTPGLDVAEDARRHLLVDARFDERQEDAA